MKNQSSVRLRDSVLLLSVGWLSACGGGAESAAVKQTNQQAARSDQALAGSDYDRPRSDYDRPRSDYDRPRSGNATSPELDDDLGSTGSDPDSPGNDESSGNCRGLCSQAGDCRTECIEFCEQAPDACQGASRSIGDCMGDSDGSCEERLTICVLQNGAELASCAPAQ